MRDLIIRTPHTAAADLIEDARRHLQQRGYHEQCSLHIAPVAAGGMGAVDPTVMSALISGGATVIAAVICAIATVLNARRQDHAAHRLNQEITVVCRSLARVEEIKVLHQTADAERMVSRFLAQFTEITEVEIR